MHDCMCMSINSPEGLRNPCTALWKPLYFFNYLKHTTSNGSVSCVQLQDELNPPQIYCLTITESSIRLANLTNPKAPRPIGPRVSYASEYFPSVAIASSCVPLIPEEAMNGSEIV